MSWNPIRRTPLRPKPREHKESAPWRAPKVRLSGPEMGELRQNVFARSEGRCENSISPERDRCPARIYWGSFHLAHIVSRGRGGSDSRENTLACCPECHFEDTRNRKKLLPHNDWIAGTDQRRKSA